MVNEAVKVELYGANNDGNPRRFVVASGASIAKGSILTLTDPRTAALCAASTAVLAGISAFEKDGSDYSTSISAWTDGIFTLKASGAITAGDAVKSACVAESNTIQTANPGSEVGSIASGAQILGYAEDDIADGTTGEVRVLI